ncbi:ABC transporter ATP-binding protein [bacterium]|nr:MAG: ABC transporter ATP-binding protein [bacterium]
MIRSKLILKDLSKKFSLRNKRSISVLNKINLSVLPGEFISVIGPSGGGKTTLFNIIAGIEEQTSGTIILDENIIASRRGKFGYMLQEPLLLPWRTVEENLILGLDIHHIPKEIALKKARLLLQQFGLEEFAKQFLSVLSGGMQQRVALLRTILFNDSFLLLDEPFGALDRITRISLQMWLMKVLKKVKTTTLFITHDIQEAILLSDKIIVLSNRPAEIKKIITVPLVRPRKPEQLTFSQSLKIEKELLSSLIDKNIYENRQ